MNKPAVTVPLLATTLLLLLALALPAVTTAYPQVQPDGANYPASSENRCPFVCKAVYEPVCGSDGQTYDSLCELKLAQCDDDSLQPAYDGLCADDDDD
ncbi:hypothetical protein OTU49_009187 [Cherax quadricarinatus]|uniref:Kazal-like domain-containing protein n=1 Tax=Cherax quadricarinatus TaxID=27406 RepID=A0AAW0WBS1_CHEQU